MAGCGARAAVVCVAAERGLGGGVAQRGLEHGVHTAALAPPAHTQVPALRIDFLVRHAGAGRADVRSMELTEASYYYY